MNLKTFCDEMTDLEMKVVINDFMIFKKQGFINESFLRHTASRYTHEIGAQFDAKWMELIAYNAMERFALRYVNDPANERVFDS